MNTDILTEKHIKRFFASMRDASMLPSGNGCHIWTGSKHNKGYGEFTVHVNKKRYKFRAHRLAYYLTYGVDPGQLHVLHSCDNPPCCNPTHLFLGTNLDNQRDRQQKMRGIKLTQEQVLQIRARLENGEANASLAKEYNVTPANITLIKTRKNWAEI
jgi:hypothetical protein